MLAQAGVLKSAEAGRLEKAVAVATAGKTLEEELACLNDLGSLLQAMGKLADAERCFRRDLDGCKATLGEDHPDTLASVENLSSLLEAMGRLEDAEPLREWLRRAEAAR